MFSFEGVFMTIGKQTISFGNCEKPPMISDLSVNKNFIATKGSITGKGLGLAKGKRFRLEINGYSLGFCRFTTRKGNTWYWKSASDTVIGYRNQLR